MQSKVGIRSIERIQTPDDLVDATVPRCSPAGDLITGQSIVVGAGGGVR